MKTAFVTYIQYIASIGASVVVISELGHVNTPLYLAGCKEPHESVGKNEIHDIRESRLDLNDGSLGF